MRLIDADALIIDLMDAGLDQIQTDDYSEIIQIVERQPTASPWHRVEEPPKKTGKYAVCWTYQGKIYWDWLIFLDGDWQLRTGLPLPAYWMPIEPPMGTERSET